MLSALLDVTPRQSLIIQSTLLPSCCQTYQDKKYFPVVDNTTQHNTTSWFLLHNKLSKSHILRVVARLSLWLVLPGLMSAYIHRITWNAEFCHSSTVHDHLSQIELQIAEGRRRGVNFNVQDDQLNQIFSSALNIITYVYIYHLYVCIQCEV